MDQSKPCRITVHALDSFREVLHCDCGNEMYWGGTTLTSSPPWYVHVCPDKNCQREVKMNDVYPRTVTMRRDGTLEHRKIEVSDMGYQR